MRTLLLHSARIELTSTKFEEANLYLKFNVSRFLLYALQIASVTYLFYLHPSVWRTGGGGQGCAPLNSSRWSASALKGRIIRELLKDRAEAYHSATPVDALGGGSVTYL